MRSSKNSNQEKPMSDQLPAVLVLAPLFGALLVTLARSEERRVGKECISTCRSRWSPDHLKKQSDDTCPAIRQQVGDAQLIVRGDNFLCVFFFKQKTAYELLRSDWSSDVCSSDLRPAWRAFARAMFPTYRCSRCGSDGGHAGPSGASVDRDNDALPLLGGDAGRRDPVGIHRPRCRSRFRGFRVPGRDGPDSLGPRTVERIGGEQHRGRGGVVLGGGERCGPDGGTV